MNIKTNMLTLNAISITLVLLATAFINIRLPFAGNGGLIHLGNVPLFVVAILFGRKTGFLAGSLGMSLFDLLSGWTVWAPFTFIIVGLMGYIVGAISEKDFASPSVRYILAMFCALLIKVIGYYFAEVVLYGNYLTPFGSILGNVIQVSVATAIALPIAMQLKKYILRGDKLCIN